MSLDTFEQSLLSELRQHVVSRAPLRSAARSTARRRWTTGLAVGGLATTATAIVLAVGSGAVGPSAAYAVDSQPNGDVVVTVFDLTDATGLEHALAAKGIHADVRYVPHFVQSGGSARTSTGDADRRCDIALAKVDGGLRFTLGAAQIAQGSQLDVVTSGASPADIGSPVAVTWTGGGC